MTRTWLFGEAEYESTESIKENYDRLFYCAESCGYMIEIIKCKNGRTCIKLDGSDLEHIEMFFDAKNKIDYIEKVQYTDRNRNCLEMVSKEELIVAS